MIRRSIIIISSLVLATVAGISCATGPTRAASTPVSADAAKEAPPPGIYALQGEQQSLVCALSEVEKQGIPEDLTSCQGTQVPLGTTRFLVISTPDLLKLGVNHRALRLVALTEGEPRPKVEVVATRTVLAGRSLKRFTVELNAPLDPGYYQFTLQLQGRSAGEILLYFFDCGFQVPDQVPPGTESG